MKLAVLENHFGGLKQQSTQKITCGVIMTGFLCRFGSTPALLGGICGGRLASLSFTFSLIDEGISSTNTVVPIETDERSANRTKNVNCSRDDV